MGGRLLIHQRLQGFYVLEIGALSIEQPLEHVVCVVDVVFGQWINFFLVYAIFGGLLTQYFLLHIVYLDKVLFPVHPQAPVVAVEMEIFSHPNEYFHV